MKEGDTQGTARGWTEHLDAAVLAAREAGRIHLRWRDRPLTVDFKGERELVTEVDRSSEETIFGILKHRFPTHDFLLEESPLERSGSEYLWVVDPLDGTTNYAHGLPHFACSIALCHREQPVLGVVLQPLLNELFVAVRGSGASMNGKPIQVSSEDRLLHSLLATGFPNDLSTSRNTNLREFETMLPLAQGIRRSGSAALDLCYLAAGRLDGYWIQKLAPWDAAAGILIVQEAGGLVTDPAGRPPSLYPQALVGSNGRIHQAMLEILAPTHGG